MSGNLDKRISRLEKPEQTDKPAATYKDLVLRHAGKISDAEAERLDWTQVEKLAREVENNE